MPARRQIMAELRNAIERAMILEDTAYIGPASLPVAATRADSSMAASGGMQACGNPRPRPVETDPLVRIK